MQGKTLEKNSPVCSEAVVSYITGLQQEMQKNGITDVSKYVETCKTNAEKMAEDVCNYHKITDETSKVNLTAQLTVGLFNFGRTLSDAELQKISGTEAKAIGKHTAKLYPPQGIAKAVKEKYSGYVTGFYQIPPYDKNTASIIGEVQNSLNIVPGVNVERGV